MCGVTFTYEKLYAKYEKANLLGIFEKIYIKKKQ